MENKAIQQSEVTPQLIIDKFSGGNSDKITEAEALMFMEECRQLGVNPMTGEAFLVKYKNVPAQTITSVEFYKRRAFENPDFHELKSGITVRHNDGTRERIEGTCFTPEDGKLIGGWATVKVMRHGTPVETFKEVSLTEYNSGRQLWLTKPATMIAKVAIGQALREAFPAAFNGTYISEEYEPQPEKAVPEPVRLADGIVAKAKNTPIPTPTPMVTSLPKSIPQPETAEKRTGQRQNATTDAAGMLADVIAEMAAAPEDYSDPTLPFPHDAAGNDITPIEEKPATKKKAETDTEERAAKVKKVKELIQSAGISEEELEKYISICYPKSKKNGVPEKIDDYTVKGCDTVINNFNTIKTQIMEAR